MSDDPHHDVHRRGILHRTPRDGTTVRFAGDLNTVLLTSDDGDGALGITYSSVPPGGGPQNHYHAEHDELFYLLDGELTFFDGERAFQAGRGDLILVPRGVVHRFSNDGVYPATMLFLYAPGGPEGLFIAGGDPPQPGRQPALPIDAPPDGRMQRLLQQYDNHLV